MSVNLIKKITPVLIILGLSYSSFLYGQEVGLLLKNSSDGEAVQFAHIFDLKSSSLYVTDLEGRCEITRLEDSLSINISHVAFEDTLITIIPSGDLTIYLKEKHVTLEDIIIYSSYKPEELLREAIKRVPVNYLQEESAFKGSYFEKLLINQKELYTIQAQIIGQKNSYKNKNSHRKLKIKENSFLVSYQKFVSDSLNLDKAIRYAGGHNIVHFMDLVKTRIEFFNKFKIYEYIFSDTLNDSFDKFYIKFFPKSKKRGFYEGLVILDRNSLAVEFCSYKLSKLGLRWADLNFIHGFTPNSILSYKSISGNVEYGIDAVSKKRYLKSCYYERVKDNINYKENLVTKTFFLTSEILINPQKEDFKHKLPPRSILIELLD